MHNRFHRADDRGYFPRHCNGNLAILAVHQTHDRIGGESVKICGSGVALLGQTLFHRPGFGASTGHARIILGSTEKSGQHSPRTTVRCGQIVTTESGYPEVIRPGTNSMDNSTVVLLCRWRESVILENVRALTAYPLGRWEATPWIC